MIYLGNVYDKDLYQYDEVWVICRKVEKIQNMINEHDYIYHVPELSPSVELFQWYRKLHHQGKWNRDAFFNQYVPKFMRIFEEREIEGILENLIEKSVEKDIKLVCFCDDETMCHRSIIGGKLLEMNANIYCNNAYRKLIKK